MSNNSKLLAINLLKNSRVNFFDTFFNWALTIGRIIVILVEIVALGAFFYRFSLDRKINDLTDEIKRKKIVVDYLKNNEEKYRNFQDRLAVAAEFEGQGQQLTQVLNDVTTKIPPDFNVSNISVSENSIRFAATTSSIPSLISVINTLKTYPTITSVSLDRVENRITTGTISISISAVIAANNPAQPL